MSGVIGWHNSRQQDIQDCKFIYFFRRKKLSASNLLILQYVFLIMIRVKAYISILAAVFACISASGQEAADSLISHRERLDMDRLRSQTNSLMLNYKFSDALAVFREAKADADSLDAIDIDEMMVQAQNGAGMTGFCSDPVVVAKERFSLKDFHLFYPLEDYSWRAVPNPLDGDRSNRFVNATYVPDGQNVLYWSSADPDGIRNIYRSEYRDTIWAAPELLNEQMTSSSDEIYPMLSPDGKQLFFASRGLYGMGGYDLYVSDWDDNLNDWGVPVNMGFPYSSPYDDFLFINTPDGKYSMFASNRDCPSDSVDIYVLEYDSMPVRKAVDSPEELKALCRLDPKSDPSRIYSETTSGGDMGENENVRHYSMMLVDVRLLRDSIMAFSQALDADRANLAVLDGDEKAALAAEILSKESILPVLQDSLLRMNKALQKLEFEFLRSGVVIDPEKLQQEAEREVVGSRSGFTFSRKNPGKVLHIEMLEPEPEFDYTFQILPEGRFALDNTLPEGLIYQIQIFVISSKATLRQIKGLSPVFERAGASGKRIYSVGLFRSYKDVLSNLNSVKRLGFRSAIIVAFNDGKPITVNKARELERSVHELFQIRIYPSNDSSLNDNEKNIIKSVTDADMARTSEDGAVSYLVGPFENRGEAESIAAALKNAGILNYRVESAGMSEPK